MSAQQAVLQVVILRDGLLVGTEVLMPGTYSIGSGASVELRLDDPTVEPLHAVLYFQNGRSAIQDNSARAGVYVNGHRVRACEVRSVDEIVVGPFVLKTRVVTKQPAVRPAPSPEVAALLGTAPPPVPLVQPVAQPARPQPPRPAAPVNRPPAKPMGQVTTAPGAQAARVPVPKPPEATVVSARRGGAAPIRLVDQVPETTRTESVPLAATTVPRAVPTARAHPPRPGPGGKGKPRLYFELYWGAVRREARSFGPIPAKKPLVGAAHDRAPVPMWGFTLPEDFAVADSNGETYRIFVPPSATVERARGGEAFLPVSPRELEADGDRRFLSLSNGMAARLCEGEMSLVAHVAPPPEKVFVNPLKGLPWLAIALFLLLGGGLVSFMVFGPKPRELPDFTAKNLPPVAVKLIAPEPKKKEEAQKKLAEIKNRAPKKEVAKAEPTPKREPTPKAAAPAPTTPQPKALKALAKLSAAGPATNDVLAAIDKMGSGPGSKNAKNNFKLSGLVGKDPIANAGIGTFGLGGGGKGGKGTKGLEMLNGRGGGGIGALGAGGFGRGGQVGGTVKRASARSIGVQGSIDREAVAKVVNSHLQEVRACYERALLKDPGLAGKVVLEWSINTAGSVTTARTKSSTLRNGAVEACILQSLKGWKFPKAQGGMVIVSYPFLFNSVGY